MPPATLCQKLGEGAFGQVYKGCYNGEHIAVKVINLQNASEREGEMAVREMNLLAQLSHPNVVHYKGGNFVCSPTGGAKLHIYMELCQGDLQHAIKQRISSGGFFSEGRIFGWFRDIVMAVQYLHSVNIIHRDIKPLNILLHNNRVKLGDFGLAKLFHSCHDLKASVVGTIIYACPEILFNQECDGKGDMWSLGCTLFQLAALDPPFHSPSEIIKFQNDRSRLNDIPNRYSQGLKNLVNELLGWDRRSRPGSTQVLQFLNNEVGPIHPQVQ